MCTTANNNSHQAASSSHPPPDSWTCCVCFTDYGNYTNECLNCGHVVCPHCPQI